MAKERLPSVIEAAGLKFRRTIFNRRSAWHACRAENPNARLFIYAGDSIQGDGRRVFFSRVEYSMPNAPAGETITVWPPRLEAQSFAEAAEMAKSVTFEQVEFAALSWTVIGTSSTRGEAHAIDAEGSHIEVRGGEDNWRWSIDWPVLHQLTRFDEWCGASEDYQPQGYQPSRELAMEAAAAAKAIFRACIGKLAVELGLNLAS
jgi:hypothetical protein